MSNPKRYSIIPGADNLEAIPHKEILTPVYASTYAFACVSKDTEEATVEMGQLTGAQTITAEVVNPRQGDKLTMIFGADGTNRVVTFSTGFTTAGTITCLANKFATINFVFSNASTTWVEKGRYVQS